jgi:flagellar biosynthesis protein FlhG
MQVERVSDQAEGLRRLLARSATRVVTVAGAHAGLGVTTLVANLAHIMAGMGREVLVLDENLAQDNIGNLLGLKPRYDLLHAVRRDKPLGEVLLQAAPALRVLPVARAMQALPRMNSMERTNLLDCLADASHGVDVVLVDAATAGPRFISANLAPNQPLLLVINATPSSITESYSLIKRMAMQDGRQSFGVVVNKVRQVSDARNIFENLAQVARQHLNVSVEYLGHIPHDPSMLRVAQLWRPQHEVCFASSAAQELDKLALSLLSATSHGEVGLPHVLQRLIRQTQYPDMVHAG